MRNAHQDTSMLECLSLRKLKLAYASVQFWCSYSSALPVSAMQLSHACLSVAECNSGIVLWEHVVDNYPSGALAVSLPMWQLQLCSPCIFYMYRAHYL